MESKLLLSLARCKQALTLAPLKPASGPIESSATQQPARPAASLRAVGLVSSLTALQLVIQFGIQVVTARHFGAGREVDAYVAALALPTVLGTMMSASLGYVLVPIIAEARRREDFRTAAVVATQIGGGLTALALMITVVVAAAAVPLTTALCSGFSSAEMKLTAALMRVLSLLIVTNSLIAYQNALHHSFGQFARPAVAGVVGTGVTLLYMALFHDRQGIFSIAWGMVGGSVVAMALMSPLVATQVRIAAISAGRLHPATRRALALLAPLVLGAIYWRIDPLLDRFLGSYLEPGSIAHMGYSSRLIGGLMLIGTSGLSIVAFPAIAAHAAAGKSESLADELAHALRFFLFLMIPICIGISVFAAPVVRLLFEYGQFTAADTQAVALLVVLYTGLILGAGLGDLFSRTSYAQQDMRTPVLISIFAFTVGALLKVLTVRWWGIAGVVGVTSFYSLLSVVILAVVLVRRISPAILQGTLGTIFRAVIASALACLAAAGIMLVPGRIAVLPAAALGAIVYFSAMWAFGDEFARRLKGRFLHNQSS
jgi:putative peptidoglycan lipid II flippase